MHGTLRKAGTNRPNKIGDYLPVGSSEIHFAEDKTVTIKRTTEDSALVEIVMSFPWLEFGYAELCCGLEEAMQMFRKDGCWLTRESPFED